MIIIDGINSQSNFAAAQMAASFGPQEIRDDPLDWINVEKNSSTLLGDVSTDIVYVNYFSDGRVLNTTMWLLFPFNESLSTDRGQINYGMLIDADFNPSTGVDGVDYQVEISGENGTWTRKFLQWSTHGTFRTLYRNDNYTGFFEKQGGYINLDVDLSSIGSPQQYRVLFYGESFNEGNLLTDFTEWIQIPPPSLEIVVPSSVIEIRPGEERKIDIQLKSTADSETEVLLTSRQQVNASSNIEVGFETDKVNLLSQSVQTIPVGIRALEGSQSGQKKVTIVANASFPASSIVDQSRVLIDGEENDDSGGDGSDGGHVDNMSNPNPSDDSDSLPSSSAIPTNATKSIRLPHALSTKSILSQATLDVRVLSSISSLDSILGWLDKFQSLILFSLGILTGLIPWLFKKLRTIS